MPLEDDDERHLERLRELGLLHLADKPDELQRELARRVVERDALIAAYEREREQLHQPVAAAPPISPAPPTSPPAPADPAPPPPRARRKSSTLLVLGVTPGPCRACRHANHGTADFQEGHLACWMGAGPKLRSSMCDKTFQVPLHVKDPVASWVHRYVFEPFDGSNGTWAVGEDYRALAVDADHEVQKAQQFMIKVIPGRDL